MASEESEPVVSTPRTILVRWANGQPAWVRFVVSEVLAVGGPVGPATVDEAFSLFLAGEQLSDGAQAPDVPMLSDGGGSAANGLPIRLLKLSDVQGVNALAPGQTIKFGDQLTVLFGQNGSGKTGYSRVIKRAAGSRTHEGILGNIEIDAAQGEPSAVFEIKVDDVSETVEWHNEVGIEHLDRIAVFDSATAAVHVTEDLGYEFTPAELARYDDVTKALQAVQERITERTTELSAQSQLALNPFTSGSVVHQQVGSISAATSLDAIRQLADVTPGETEALQEKKNDHAALISGTDGAPALQLQQQLQEIGEVTEVIAILAAFDPAAYNAALEEFTEAQRAVARLQSTMTSAAVPGAPLGEHGERFIRAGAEYASQLGLSGYPDEDSVCLYCGQSLGAEALALVRRYGSFLTSAAQAQHDSAQEAFTATLPQLDEGRLQPSPDKQSAFPEPPDALAAAATLCEDARSLPLRTAERQPCPDREIPDRAQQLLPQLAALQARVGTAKGELAEKQSDRDEAIPALDSEIRDLEDRVKLAQHLPSIERCVDNAKTAARLTRCNEVISRQVRRSLTEESKRASAEAVNRNFATYFKEECEELKGREIALSFQGRSGKSERKKLIKDHRPTEVLSEGELKVLALADFLAECRTSGSDCPVVFDDPVCSLDDRNSELIAERLSELAEERQVIILTHDVMFAAALIADRQSKQRRTTFVEVLDSGTELKGLIGQDVEPRLDTPNNLAKRTDRAIERAKTETDLVRKDEFIADAYSLMRSWCEAFVEQELFQNVTQRFRRNVMMTRLPRVRVDRLADAIEVISKMFDEISGRISGHSHPFRQSGTKPTEGQLERDWDRLKTAADRYEGEDTEAATGSR
ncbi:MAG: AAA family ATPase [Acidimicrobiaceae bacterium]|nr:AAA family ATPase [Acidimicrobiaceae bacterium]